MAPAATIAAAPATKDVWAPTNSWSTPTPCDRWSCARSRASSLHRYARTLGMKTMREDAWRKALHGITTVDEVIRRTRADDPLERNVQAAVGE
ncbi:MAG: hypothetical protein HC888_17715 [Candidatus Competibacteraceae bacterium]|nr:hypothetical protein [Candidatus Competibacteraceae bacterium]